jgi:hypothetical protein
MIKPITARDRAKEGDTLTEFEREILIWSRKIWRVSEVCNQVDLDEVQAFLDFCCQGPGSDAGIFDHLHNMDDEAAELYFNAMEAGLND